MQQKWEYLVVYIKDSKVHQDNPEVDAYMDVDKYTEALNKYGSAGWELVSFTSDGDGAKAAFKRPAAQHPPVTQFVTPSEDSEYDD